MIGAIIGGLSGLAQLGLGIADRVKGKREREKAQAFFEANKYAIPEGARASLQTAERMASSTRLPAEDLRRAQMQEATSQGVGAYQNVATSAADVQAGLSQLFGQQMMGEQNLAIQGAQRFDENQRQLQRAQEMFGQYEDIQWQQNVLAPYNQRMNAAAQYSQRGAQGISGGIAGLAGTGAGLIQMSGEQGRFDEYMNYLNGTGGTEQYDPSANRAFLRTNLGNIDPMNGFRTGLKPYNASTQDLIRG